MRSVTLVFPWLSNIIVRRLCLDCSGIAQFNFVSSISAVYNYDKQGPVAEAVIDNPTVAQDIGYAQSKVSQSVTVLPDTKAQPSGSLKTSVSKSRRQSVFQRRSCE